MTGLRSAPTSSSSATRILGKVGLAQPALGRAATGFWTASDLSSRFPRFLLALHAIIRASVPLMEAGQRAARTLLRDAPEDRLAAGLAAYYGSHIVEERDHDAWLLDDLETMGISRQEALATPPSPTIAALVGAQYYWIRHVHPVALLGYLLVIEGHPPDVAELAELERRSGAPATAFRTMVKHAELDPHHRDDLLATLDLLPLARHHETLVVTSAYHTLARLTELFAELVD